MVTKSVAARLLCFVRSASGTYGRETGTGTGGEGYPGDMRAELSVSPGHSSRGREGKDTLHWGLNWGKDDGGRGKKGEIWVERTLG